ncbi:MAG: hypothetical protein AABO41_26330 [Acidobacteriota bacterium]
MGNSVTRFAKIAAFIVMSIAATENLGLAQSKSGRIDKLITRYHKYGQFNGVILVEPQTESAGPIGPAILLSYRLSHRARVTSCLHCLVTGCVTA